MLSGRDRLFVTGDRLHGKYANDRVERQPGIPGDRRGGRADCSLADGLTPGKNYNARR